MSRLTYLVLALALGLIGAVLYATPVTPELSSTADFGGVSLKIEYATSTAAREQGLGGRESIPSDYGMLFVFPVSDYYGFWMKETLVPLDIYWLNDQGQVIYVAQDVATATYPTVFYPPLPARYVLETRAGFASTHNVATGTPLRLKKWPSVSE